MNIAEQITALENKRAANVGALDAIVKKASEAGRSMDEAEAEEFETLSAEVESLDDEIKRMKSLERYKASEAKPVEGESKEAGTKSRAGIVVTSPDERLEPGVSFARLAKCKALSRIDGESPRYVARSLYGENSSVYGLLSKAAVSGATAQDTTWAGNLVGDESSVFADFVEFLRPQTILGQFGANGIPSLRRVPFRVRLASQTSGGSGYWVGEGNAKPLTSWAYGATTLEPLKVANIAVATEELLRDSSPSAELLIRDELAAALRERLDIDFIDPAKSASSNVSPASITNGVSPVASVGCDAEAVRCDITNLFSEFASANNPLRTGVWVMGTATAINLWQMRNPLGQREFPSLTLTGGIFEGLPVIVSDNVPPGIVVLLNAGDIYLGDDGGINVDMSREASLEMDDSPSSNSTTPTPAQMVSMFQTNSVAFRAERTINWAARRSSAVAVLDGVAWGCCDDESS